MSTSLRPPPIPPGAPQLPGPLRRRRRPRRWIALVPTLVLLIPTLVSYSNALAAPGNDRFGIRSTEWLRSHHFRWLVNDVENFWYSHHQPKKGGRPTGDLLRQLTGAGTARAGGAGGGSSKPGTVTPASTPPDILPAPAPIQPFVTTPMVGEGQWRVLGTPVHGQAAMYATFLRPDAIHTSLVSGVAWIDPKLVKAVSYAGVLEPGGGPWVNQAPIPYPVRPNLLAAFNSGFKMQDSQGGFYANGHYARALRDGGATAYITSDGVLHVGQWGRDVTMGPNIVSARQNLALIVDGGQPVPDVLSGNTSKWGATVGNKVLVWRSGIGVTANGAVVYVGSAGLSALTLAQLLARAGAVRAMELDINSAWVDFFTYGPAPAGIPAYQLSVTKLLADMSPSTSNYLTPTSRDFFALFSR
jgi:hypothetical protein